jgi:hypothetical protein
MKLVGMRFNRKGAALPRPYNIAINRIRAGGLFGGRANRCKPHSNKNFMENLTSGF